MSSLSVSFYSNAMSRKVEFEMILPNDLPEGMKGSNPAFLRNMKTLVLLHGFSGSSREWLYGSSIEEIACKYNLAVLMPSAENSFYLDAEGTGRAYGTYTGRELLEYARKTFGLSSKKEDTIIGGYSMGGFGAIHVGLSNPDLYGGIFALSSALIIHKISGLPEGAAEGPADYAYYRGVFGDLSQLELSRKNPEVLIRELKRQGMKTPPMFLACGTEDFLLENNRAFYRFLQEEGVENYRYEEGPGMHNWTFWNTWLEPALKWLLGE